MCNSFSIFAPFSAAQDIFSLGLPWRRQINKMPFTKLVPFDKEGDTTAAKGLTAGHHLRGFPSTTSSHLIISRVCVPKALSLGSMRKESTYTAGSRCSDDPSYNYAETDTFQVCRSVVSRTVPDQIRLNLYHSDSLSFSMTRSFLDALHIVFGFP